MNAGLILNNDFSFGKLSTLLALGRNSNVIRAHSSRYAANYLQGAAATVTVVRGLDVAKLCVIMNSRHR